MKYQQAKVITCLVILHEVNELDSLEYKDLMGGNVRLGRSLEVVQVNKKLMFSIAPG